MTLFHELPHDARMRIRYALESPSLGNEVTGYNGQSISLMIARGKFAETLDIARSLGLEIVNGSRYWFPAETGSPDHLLHWKRKEDTGNRSMAYNAFASFYAVL